MPMIDTSASLLAKVGDPEFAEHVFVGQIVVGVEESSLPQVANVHFMWLVNVYIALTVRTNFVNIKTIDIKGNNENNSYLPYGGLRNQLSNFSKIPHYDYSLSA